MVCYPEEPLLAPPTAATWMEHMLQATWCNHSDGDCHSQAQRMFLKKKKQKYRKKDCKEATIKSQTLSWHWAGGFQNATTKNKEPVAAVAAAVIAVVVCNVAAVAEAGARLWRIMQSRLSSLLRALSLSPSLRLTCSLFGALVWHLFYFGCCRHCHDVKDVLKPNQTYADRQRQTDRRRQRQRQRQTCNNCIE